MDKTKNIFRLTATIVATIIGAGFATGQEIYSFFNIYGKWSFIGFTIVFILFNFAFATVLRYCYTHNINDFSGFLGKLGLGGAGKWIEWCVALFSFCGFCAMAAATGTLCTQTLHQPYLYGVIAMIALCFVILLFDIQAVATVNLVLAPIICIGIIFFSLHGILFRSVETFAAAHYYRDIVHILFSAILYASYNILSAVVVLCSMRRYCDSIRTIRISGFAGAGILVMLALLIWGVISVYSNKVPLGDIPMLSIAARGGDAYRVLYSLLLLASVLTTAIGCGYAVIDFLKNRFKASSGTASIITSLAAVPVCMLGFAGIVRVLYSFFGYLGLPFLFILVYAKIKLSRKSKRNQKIQKMR